jgi:hypothetical protein
MTIPFPPDNYREFPRVGRNYPHSGRDKKEGKNEQNLKIMKIPKELYYRYQGTKKLNI